MVIDSEWGGGGSREDYTFLTFVVRFRLQHHW